MVFLIVKGKTVQLLVLRKNVGNNLEHDHANIFTSVRLILATKTEVLIFTLRMTCYYSNSLALQSFNVLVS